MSQWLGLIGVVVGVVLGGAGQAWREHVAARRVERAAEKAVRADVRTAARVVAAEMSLAHSALGEAHLSKTGPLPGLLTDEMWVRHREALASHLDDDQWVKVMLAYTTIKGTMIVSQLGEGHVSWGDGMSEQWRARIDDGIRVLRPLGTPSRPHGQRRPVTAPSDPEAAPSEPPAGAPGPPG